jgi:hypothetical protein
MTLVNNSLSNSSKCNNCLNFIAFRVTPEYIIIEKHCINTVNEFISYTHVVVLKCLEYCSASDWEVRRNCLVAMAEL